MNVPGFSVSLPYISEKDEADIIFGIENEVDFIAASFTRNEQDILDIKKILDRYHCRSIKIIAKIENAEGVKNIDDILRAVSYTHLDVYKRQALRRRLHRRIRNTTLTRM